MQPFKWYIKRLSVMSPQEMGRRIRSALVDRIDHVLLPLRQRPRPLTCLLQGPINENDRGFTVATVPVRAWPAKHSGDPEYDWLQSLQQQATQNCRHCLSFFDRENQDLGHPIDWNRDHKSGKPAPAIFAPSVDYRDFRVTGDCKFVWEPNRHHHLVVLARAYRASGDQCYAKAVAEQLASWLDQCPFGIGMNWRSPLELAIRLINWVWALDLIRESNAIDPPLHERLIDSVHRHLWEITRKYSGGSSAGNHLIGEAAGVFIAASYFRRFKAAPQWIADSRDILAREILRQTFPDGGGVEQALGYHSFILKFFLLAGHVARLTGNDFPPEYWARLEKMFEFEAALCQGGLHSSMFGDNDDGYVLDLGSHGGDFRPALAIGSVLFNRSDFKAAAANFSEPAYWLLGQSGMDRFRNLAAAPAPLTSRALPDSGYYLLQAGTPTAGVSVTFDCGSMGLMPMAGHGHADALSFTLRLLGCDVFVDPGTYDYFTYPAWRTWFRSTAAHNTVLIDGRDQSEMAGPFMWGQKARARCTLWQPADSGGTVAGEHDGYTRLADPVIHRRTLQLDARQGKLVIRDDIIARGRHRLGLHFHAAEQCQIRALAPHRFQIDFGPGAVTLTLDPRLTTDMLTGSEDPIGGWVSRGYHRKSPAAMLTARCTTDGDISLTSEVTFENLLHNL